MIPRACKMNSYIFIISIKKKTKSRFRIPNIHEGFKTFKFFKNFQSFWKIPPKKDHKDQTWPTSLLEGKSFLWLTVQQVLSKIPTFQVIVHSRNITLKIKVVHFSKKIKLSTPATFHDLFPNPWWKIIQKHRFNSSR